MKVWESLKMLYQDFEDACARMPSQAYADDDELVIMAVFLDVEERRSDIDIPILWSKGASLHEPLEIGDR